MTRSAKAVPMCVVRVGHRDLLMPSDVGMKLVALLQSAFNVERDYADRGYTYTVKDQPEVEFALVRPGQIVQPRAPSAARSPIAQLGFDDLTDR